MSLPSRPTSFILPDLISHCTFPLSYHTAGSDITKQSTQWLESNCPDLTLKQVNALRGLCAGELARYCYATTSPGRLRVVSDFMNYLFHLDDISDGMMARETNALSNMVMDALWFSDNYRPRKEQPDEEPIPGKLARDFWTRFITDAGPGVQARFKETLGLFFEAVNVQAQIRYDKTNPVDLESYIDLRRDTSGFKPCCALVEYSLNIDLPDYVVEHPVIKGLNQGTNDAIAWSNDIFSYNVEQSRGDNHNMISILMKYYGHDLQSAINYAGDLCARTVDAFSENRNHLPSWGAEVDYMVKRYVNGLQDWIVG
ncbi:isoprenoid synthase domain-containing protein [Collybia nuda]|uniref:Terpene synthase n=1 Tax=Collybia nuda TaxID=64659 RepID=A0A9P6CC37_9AGAR|nr:isoprenoid synthase domain-containing protein [Collybia nuda]